MVLVLLLTLTVMGLVAGMVIVVQKWHREVRELHDQYHKDFQALVNQTLIRAAFRPVGPQVQQPVPESALRGDTERGPNKTGDFSDLHNAIMKKSKELELAAEQAKSAPEKPKEVNG